MQSALYSAHTVVVMLQLVCKHRTGALSIQYSIYISSFPCQDGFLLKIVW